MRCLGLETASLSPGVGLAVDEEIGWERAGSKPAAKAQAVFVYLAEAREAGRLDLAALDLIAVTAGPGSFTGLKVGLAAAKAFGFALNLPCVGVSSLFALARTAARHHPEALLSPIIDARRQMIYAALFKVSAGRVERLSHDAAVFPEDWAKKLGRLEAGGPVVLAGEGLVAYDEFFAERLADKVEIADKKAWPISPGEVARLGIIEAQAGRAVDPFALEANYLRRPDAVLPKRPLKTL